MWRVPDEIQEDAAEETETNYKVKIQKKEDMEIFETDMQSDEESRAGLSE